MHATQIIKHPVITEKSTWEAANRNRYSFEVHQKASKPQIRQAVQSLYDVRVTSVATVARRGRYRRTRFGPARTKDWKKAVVELHPDDHIDLF